MWLAIAYVALSSVLTLHTVFQFWLLLASRRSHRLDTPGLQSEPWPWITVQLPIYNERYVAARLLDAVARLDYPRGRIEIQVLDDSTDDTVALVADRCRVLREEGLEIEHVRRGDRTGFKAGALQHGLSLARGELVLLFDADFMPAPDFLRRTVPHFIDPRVAAVQARWTHANRDQSLLTRIQGFFLDAHFSIEQIGRRQLGCFVNFNGTAGIWRVEAIRDAGGWRPDTLTEDLDLSYRTQLRGWRIVFLEHVEVPAELPGDLRAFRVQQYRWMKGVSQNAVRLWSTILRAPLRARVKAHALAHLFEPSNFPAMLMVLLLTPIAAREVAMETMSAWTVLNPLWLANAVLLAAVYFAPRRGQFRDPADWVGGLVLWIGFLAISTGLALHHTIAVLAGFTGQRSEFVRTPKAGAGAAIVHGAYRIRGFDGVLVLEVLLWMYLLGALIWGVWVGTLYLLWIPVLAFVGLTAVLIGYLRPWLLDRLKTTPAQEIGRPTNPR